MKYFLHDSNSFNDEKITELFINFGYEGLGLFYTILEKIASQEKPIKTDVLKHQLKVGKKLEKCWLFLEKIELISTNNCETFNKQLLNFSERYKIKKENNAKRILEWRKNQDDTKNVTRYEHVCNTPKVKESKVKESKVNESKVKEIIISNFNFKNSLLELGIEKTIVEDWIKVRKEKKAVNTQTAFETIKNEISKSNSSPNECIKLAVERSWGGFKSEWIKNETKQIIKNETNYEELFRDCKIN